MNYSRTFKFSPRISAPPHCLNRKVILLLCPWRFERTELLVLSVNGRRYRITISTIARTIRYCLYDDFVSVAVVSKTAGYTQERLITPKRPVHITLEKIENTRSMSTVRPTVWTNLSRKRGDFEND